MDPDIIPLTEEDLHDLYLWVDEIPLSRPKRNIARDFSDGVCVAEAVKYYFPKLVELHNYQSAHSVQGKIANWETLNTRVFRKLFFEVPAEEIRDITAAVPGAVERFLRALRIKIEQIQMRQQQRGASPQQQQQSSSAAVRGGASGRPVSAAAAPREQQQAATGVSPRSRVSPQRPSSAASPQHQQQQQQSRSAAQSQHNLQQEVYELRDILREKDHTIQQLQEAVALLTEKTAQLEELVYAKDDEVRMLLKQQQQQQPQQRGGSAGGTQRSSSQQRVGSGGGPTASGNGWRR